MDAVTRPLDQKEYSSEKIDLRVWRRLIAYAMRRKGDVVRLACVLLVVSSIDILYPQLTRYAINHFIEGNTTQGLWAFSMPPSLPCRALACFSSCAGPGGWK